MSLITIDVGDADPARVISGSLRLPRVGVWHLDVKVDSETEIEEGLVAIVDINGGDLSLLGTVTRAIEYQGITQVRIVGGNASADETGARGLQRMAKPRYYAGGTVGGVLADLLSDCGNQLADDADAGVLATPLPAWTSIMAPIGRQIAELLHPLEGAAWRMNAEGKVWVGYEAWPETDIDDEDWQTLDYDHLNGIISFGLLAPTLLPGTTIGGYRADRVEMTVTGDSVTAMVWEPRDDGARVDRDLLALGRGSVRPLDFLGLYTGKTTAQSEQTFDLQPDDERLPAMIGIPIRHGFPGLKVTVDPGATLLVGWQNGDPRLPYCALWGGGETVQAATMLAAQIQLGADKLIAAQHGLVLAKCVDTFTGLPHFALGGTSAAVMAKE